MDRDSRSRPSTRWLVPVVLAAMAIGWWLWPQSEGSGTPLPGVLDRSAARAVDEAGVVGAGASPAPAPARTEALQWVARVVDGEGRPLAGASVTTREATVTTDAGGIGLLPLERLASGQVLTASHPGHRPTVHVLTDDDLGHGTRELTLHRTASVRGTVMDHVGAPLGDVAVAVHDGRHAGLREDSLLGSARTGADGTFVVELPHGGPVQVVARKFGFVASHEAEHGGVHEVLRTTVAGERQLDLRLVPVLVSAVGIVNATNVPNEEVAHFCAFSRAIPQELDELPAAAGAVAEEARARLREVGSAFAHLGLWFGTPRVGGTVPAQLQVQVALVDGSSAVLTTPLVPLANVTVGDIVSHAFAPSLELGTLELQPAYPTTVALVQEGQVSAWQRTLQPAAGPVRVVLPAGRHVVAPSPLTGLDPARRRREVEVVRGTTTVLQAADEPPFARVELVVADAAGPVELRWLQLRVQAATGLLTLRGLAGRSVVLYLEPGRCTVRVHDGGGRLRGRLGFEAAPGMAEPVLVRID